MSAITEFFAKTGTDDKDRSLDEILSKDYAWMESSHDFIQWLFPLNEPSNYNPNAPLLTKEDIDVIRENKGNRPLWYNVFDGVEKYLNFMGIRDIWIFDTFDRFELTDEFEERRHVWMETPNHNHLRITRLLKFLRLIGWNRYGTDLLDFMKEVARENNVELNVNSMDYWEDAVEHYKRNY